MIAAVHPSPARQTSTKWRARSASGLSRSAPVSVLAFSPKQTIYAQEQAAEFISEVILGVVRTDGIAAWVAAARLSLASAALALPMPGLTALSFVLLIAVWSIILGVLALAAAVRLRRDHGRRWLALDGVASTVFGALLFAAPLIDALMLTWWLGAYAIVFGGLPLALASVCGRTATTTANPPWRRMLDVP